MGYQIWLAAELLQEVTCTIARAGKNPGLIARASKFSSSGQVKMEVCWSGVQVKLASVVLLEIISNQK